LPYIRHTTARRGNQSNQPFAVNYLAGFVPTHLLLPLVMASARRTRANVQAYDLKARERLKAISLELTGLTVDAARLESHDASVRR
jgi:hypothetical protein